jgi:hypothetical protein
MVTIIITLATVAAITIITIITDYATPGWPGAGQGAAERLHQGPGWLRLVLSHVAEINSFSTWFLLVPMSVRKPYGMGISYTLQNAENGYVQGVWSTMLEAKLLSPEQLTDRLLDIDLGATCKTVAEHLHQARAAGSWAAVDECARSLADLSRYATAALLAERMLPVEARHDEARVRALLVPLVAQLQADPRLHIGLMAQDVEQIRPDAVTERDGLKHVSYSRATRWTWAFL